MRDLRHDNVVRVLGAVYSKGSGKRERCQESGGGVGDGDGNVAGGPRLSILYELCDAGSLGLLLLDMELRGSGGGNGGKTLGTPGSLRVCPSPVSYQFVVCAIEKWLPF